MKKSILAVLLLSCVVAYAQPGFQPLERGKLFKTHATYTSSTADTTGWIGSINGRPILSFREVGLICTSTDSLQAAVYVIGRNNKVIVGGVKAYTATYTDSISTILFAVNGHTAFATTPYYKVIMLKDGKVDQLSGCDDFRVGTVFTAAVSNRAARSQKWYLWYTD